MCRMEMEPGKLFIGGISWDTNEDRLREYFQTFGEVVEAVIMKDRTTGRARGFGFVVFADPAAAERVIKEKHMIDGRTVSFSIEFISYSTYLVIINTRILVYFNCIICLNGDRVDVVVIYLISKHLSSPFWFELYLC